MKSMMVTRAQRQVLETLTKRDFAALRKNPDLLSGSKHLLVACKKVIKKLEAIPHSAGHKRREGAYKRIIAMCEKAIEKAEG